MRHRPSHMGNGWPVAPVSRIAEVNPTAILPSREFNAKKVPLYEMATIDEYQGTLRKAEWVPLETCRTGKTKFQTGDVLFAKITPCVQNGKSALVSEIDADIGFGSSEFYVLRPTPSILPEFLFYFIRQDRIKQAAVDSFTGTSGRQRVPKHFWDSLEIPIPPIPVQERIVQILEKADEIRCKRKEAMETAETVASSAFIAMFGDPRENPKGFPVSTLGEVIESGPQNGLYKPEDSYGSGVKIVRTKDYYSGAVVDFEQLKTLECNDSEIQKYKLDAGDIIINRVNSEEYVGKCALIPILHDRVVFESNTMRFKVNSSKVLPEYVIGFLCSRSVRDQIRSIGARRRAVNMVSINQQDLRGLEIAIAPLEYQTKFLSAIRHYMLIATELSSAHDGASTLFEGLLGRAFAGELTAEWETANAEEITARVSWHERLPSLVLLGLLVERAKQQNKGPAGATALVTALMKYAFLLQMEGSARRRFYHFIPYHYGPFSKEVYDDLNRLEQEGLIVVENDREEDKTKITVRDLAQAEGVLASVPEELRADSAGVIEEYGHLNHNSLLQAVYKKYPAYAKKSRLRKGRGRPTEQLSLE